MKVPTNLARRLVGGMTEVMELVGRNKKRSVWVGKNVTELASALLRSNSGLQCGMERAEWVLRMPEDKVCGHVDSQSRL